MNIIIFGSLTFTSKLLICNIWKMQNDAFHKKVKDKYIKRITNFGVRLVIMEESLRIREILH